MRLNLSRRDLILLIVSLILLAFAVRAVFLYVETYDMTKYVLNWYRQLYQTGTVKTLAGDSYNYTPTYLYLLDFMTHFRWMPDLVAIKIISIAFDFFAAGAVYSIARLISGRQWYAWLGFFTVLFLPTVVVESSLWGQCDIIYTSFLLWSLYFLLKEKGLLAVLAFAVGFAFKLQAIFFAPLLLLLLLRGKVKLWHFLTVPIVYFVAMIPAWMAGRPLPDLLTIYLHQTGISSQLSMRAANPYIFLSNRLYDLFLWIGLSLAFLALLGWFLFRLFRRKEISGRTIIIEAALFTFFIPFILPKMHERYFFAGCLFFVVLALLDHEMIVPAILAHVSSLLSYIPYFTGWPDTWAMVAAVINFVLVVFVVLKAGDWFKTRSGAEEITAVMQPFTDISRIH